MMIINRRLCAVVFASTLATCSGELNSSAASSASAADLQIDVNPIQHDALVLSPASDKPYWKVALAALGNRPSKRKLGKNNNPADKPHFVPDNEVQVHRFLEVGDYVDPTFNCPATYTCPLICVETAADCPSGAICASASAETNPDHEYELCNDDNCADFVR